MGFQALNVKKYGLGLQYVIVNLTHKLSNLQLSPSILKTEVRPSVYKVDCLILWL
jgi:hypothetical protein